MKGTQMRKTCTACLLSVELLLLKSGNKAPETLFTVTLLEFVGCLASSLSLSVFFLLQELDKPPLQCIITIIWCPTYFRTVLLVSGRNYRPIENITDAKL